VGSHGDRPTVRPVYAYYSTAMCTAAPAAPFAALASWPPGQPGWLSPSSDLEQRDGMDEPGMTDGAGEEKGKSSYLTARRAGHSQEPPSSCLAGPPSREGRSKSNAQTFQTVSVSLSLRKDWWRRRQTDHPPKLPTLPYPT
jgi:hypothetical protein